MNKWLSHLIFGLAPTVILLLLGEWLCFLWFNSQILNRANFDFVRKYSDKPQIFREVSIEGKAFYQTDYFPTRYYTEHSDLRGKIILKEKPQESFRIFTLGGSSTAGSPFGHWASFGNLLLEQLRRHKKQNVTLELLNFGVSGFGSTRALEILSEVAIYEPDLVILYSGHNEHCDNYLLAKQIDLENKAEVRDPYQHRVQHLEWIVEQSYIFRVAHYYLNRIQPVELPAEPFTAEACSKKSRLAPATPKVLSIFDRVYRENVSAMATLGNQYDFDLLLLSQPSNYLIPPFSKGESEREIYEQKVLSAIETDAWDEVQKFLLAHPNEGAVSDYARGMLALSQARNFVALEAFRMAIDRDVRSIRFRPQYGVILDSIAKANPHVFYIDIIRELEDHLDDGVIDGRVIIDTVHPTLTTQAFIAESIIENYLSLDGRHRAHLDLASLRIDSVWNHMPLLEDYRLICRRFFQISKWKECVDLMYSEYSKATTILKKRQAARAWESLVAFGIEMNVPGMVNLGHSIFRAPWKISANIEEQPFEPNSR